jgi:hypothetical protein
LTLTKEHNLLKIDISRRQVAAAIASIMRKFPDLRKELMGDFGTEITTSLRIWADIAEDEESEADEDAPFWVPDTKVEVEQALISWAVTGDTAWIDRVLCCIDEGEDAAKDASKRLRAYADQHPDLAEFLGKDVQGTKVMAPTTEEKLTSLINALMQTSDWQRVVFVAVEKPQELTIGLYDDPPLSHELPDLGLGINVRKATAEELAAVTAHGNQRADLEVI